jgi:hypothetical protein
LESNASALENWSPTLQLWKIGVQRFSFGIFFPSNAFFRPTLQLWKIGVQRFSFGKLESNALALENFGVQSFGGFLESNALEYFFNYLILHKKIVVKKKKKFAFCCQVCIITTGFET